MSEPYDHGRCRDVLRDAAAALGADAIVTHRRDHDCAWWSEMTCPHGITLWSHPTDEQFKTWKREGTP